MYKKKTNQKLFSCYYNPGGERLPIPVWDILQDAEVDLTPIDETAGTSKRFKVEVL